MERNYLKSCRFGPLLVCALYCLSNCVPVSAQDAAKISAASTKDNSRKQPIEFTNSIGMKFRLIPASEFMMGSSESFESMKKNYGLLFAKGFDVREHPQHRVRITKPFRIGVTEVTQEQYQRVMGTNPSDFSAKGPCADIVRGLNTSTFPVDGVSWQEAGEFCRRLSLREGVEYRLPTEAEWEYACRAGTKTRWCCGDDTATLQEYAWCRDPTEHPEGRTYYWSLHPVAQKKPNEWGLYDMHGNVTEWCSDWFSFDYYARSPIDNPPGPATPTKQLESYRVARGGGAVFRASQCRSAFRVEVGERGIGGGTGFRVVMDSAGK